jgi:heme exporter protein A
MTRLEVANLSKRFGRRWLFRKLSFGLDGGTSLAITGSNGSGKSTLMRLVAGVLTPTAGRVDLLVDGSPVAEEHRSRYMGFVAPYLQLYDGLTLRENLRFVQRVRGLEHDESATEEAIQRVGLEGRGDDFVSTFSSGMKQRARFAVSEVVDARVLLLDEPTSNLDESGIAIVKRIVDENVSRNRAVIIATNSSEESSWCESALNVETFLPVNRR